MNNQSIEFDKVNEDPSLPKIIRKSFRVPIEDDENAWAVINAKRYPIRNISLEGVGIVLDDTSVFSIEQTFTHCELNIFNASIKELNGRVVHLSSDLGKVLQCGIEWIDLEEQLTDEILTIVQNMKDKLLNDDII